MLYFASSMSLEMRPFIPQDVPSADAIVRPASEVPGERRGRVPHEIFELLPSTPPSSTERRRLTDEEQTSLRDNFAPGKAGSIAFNAFKYGEPCAAEIPDPENGGKTIDCGKQAAATIGFDVPDDYDVLGACSQEHWYKIATLMDSHVKPGDHDHSFDINGWGRA